MTEDKDKSGSSYYEFTLLSMVGTQLVVSIFLGFGFGYLLDQRFETKPFLMLLFGILGIVAGFLNIYRTVKNKVGKD